MKKYVQAKISLEKEVETTDIADHTDFQRFRKNYPFTL